MLRSPTFSESPDGLLPVSYILDDGGTLDGYLCREAFMRVLVTGDPYLTSPTTRRVFRVGVQSMDIPQVAEFQQSDWTLRLMSRVSIRARVGYPTSSSPTYFWHYGDEDTCRGSEVIRRLDARLADQK